MKNFKEHLEIEILKSLNYEQINKLLNDLTDENKKLKEQLNIFTTEELILEKNEKLFQEHPLKEMYVKDKDAIMQCMRDFSRMEKLDSSYIFNMWTMAQKYNCDDFYNIVRNTQP